MLLSDQETQAAAYVRVCLCVLGECVTRIVLLLYLSAIVPPNGIVRPCYCQTMLYCFAVKPLSNISILLPQALWRAIAP